MSSPWPQTSQSPLFDASMTRSPRPLHNFSQSPYQSQASQVPRDDDIKNNDRVSSTPPPEPLVLWTDPECIRFMDFLKTAPGPLTIVDIELHTGRRPGANPADEDVPFPGGSVGRCSTTWVKVAAWC
ncbi:hypothetical protein CSUB01_10761 [Colletotrichum sublineola]|uniref:Uncharacterized protein n=1 Tax=Colletotrichum sublineola TaxID=1173701 RepID=A0A066X392_COLSU|nr:hypothetical protein CSUB01_10761 [Colletotrichum sublineola]